MLKYDFAEKKLLIGTKFVGVIMSKNSVGVAYWLLFVMQKNVEECP